MFTKLEENEIYTGPNKNQEWLFQFYFLGGVGNEKNTSLFLIIQK